MTTIYLDGTVIKDIDSFFDEIDRKLCPEMFGFGRNFNALMDVCRGGFGAFDYNSPATIIWLNSDKSREALGWDYTIKHYKELLSIAPQPEKEELEFYLRKAKQHKGPTLFEYILDVMGDTDDHPNTKLILQ